MKTPKHLLLSCALVLAPCVSAAQQRQAEDPSKDIGEHEYFVSCASCHGGKGKGDGPFAVWLKRPPTNLTTIQKQNGGIFPFDRVYQVIDGRTEVAAHGPRDMPIWGEAYKRDAIGGWGAFGTPNRVDSFVRGRILALTGYIYTLQEK
jgi:mono/diheme cytochrome c family protein